MLILEVESETAGRFTAERTMLVTLFLNTCSIAHVVSYTSLEHMYCRTHGVKSACFENMYCRTHGVSNTSLEHM